MDSVNIVKSPKRKSVALRFELRISTCDAVLGFDDVQAYSL